MFGGKDMTGWKLKNAKLPNGWKVANGLLENKMPSSDIVTEQKFKDFKLHLEFNVAPKSNSGVYLRGRYKVQIQDDFGKPPESRPDSFCVIFCHLTTRPDPRAWRSRVGRNGFRRRR